jgi:hypothetical protein
MKSISVGHVVVRAHGSFFASMIVLKSLTILEHAATRVAWCDERRTFQESYAGVSAFIIAFDMGLRYECVSFVERFLSSPTQTRPSDGGIFLV